MTEAENILVRLLGDGASYQRMLRDAQAQTARTAAEINRSSGAIRSVSGAVNGFGETAISTMAQLGLAVSGISFLRGSVRLAAEAEQLDISFSTMLGSAEAGKKMMADLMKLDRDTPMTLGTVQQATRTLLQFGTEGKNIIPILRMIGDVTGGEQEKFQRLTLAFGQMTAAGRLMGQDLLQMINAGFNPLQQIAQNTGRTMAELKKDMERGAISTRMVIEAFQTASSAGGRFDGLMKKQSKSFTGMLSTMQSEIENVMRAVGKEVIDTLDLKGWVGRITSALQTIKTFIAELSPGAKRFIAALAIATIAVFAFAAAWKIVGIAITAATGGLNLVLAAVVAGIAAVVLWISQTEEFAQAWAWVKEQALAAWEWLDPIRAAVLDLWGTIVRRAGEAWAIIRGAAVSAWQEIQARIAVAMSAIKRVTGVSWGEIRDEIVNALMMAEYAITRLGDVWNLAVDLMALGFVKFANRVEHFFTKTLPAMARAIGANLGNISQVFAWIATGNFSAAIQGAMIIGRDINSQLPKRQKGELEKFLEKKVDKQINDFASGFERFKEGRRKGTGIGGGLLGGMGIPEPTPGLDLGPDAAPAVKAAKKTIEKFDAVLFNSFEARSRVAAQAEMFADMRGGAVPKDKKEQYLKEINQTLKDDAKKPVLNVKFAGL